MRNLQNIFLLLGATAVLGTACKKEVQEDRAVNAGQVGTFSSLPKDTLRGVVTANKTLTSNKEWALDGLVYVQPGVTLTIQPGTLIKGVPGVPGDTTKPGGGLIIAKGATINANGSAAAPIIFTSSRAAGTRKPGDWAGIIILGKADINAGDSARIEGVPGVPPGVSPYYGGSINTDNSGIFRYVRIEYAGYRLSDGNEINGLTLGGVGSGTQIDHVQVSYSNDDAIEIFGGTVNLKYVIALAPRDDAFDFDFGYTGKLQFGLSWIDSLYADQSQSNGIECDNNATGSTALPNTRPVLSNFTIIGLPLASTAAKNVPIFDQPGLFGTYGRGNHWRRNSSFVLRNSIVMGYTRGVSLDGSLGSTQQKYQGTSTPVAFLKQNLVHAFTTVFAVEGGTYTAAAFATKAAADGNSAFTGAPNTSIKLTNPFNKIIPGFFLPVGGASPSPALTGAVYDADLTDPFFDQTGAFRGAAGTSNWAAGWANFNPNATAY
jgi:hypothetical protein